MMRPVKELAALARKLDPFAFSKQMGPFVLMQRPGSEPASAGDWMSSTAKLPPASVVKEKLEPAVLEELLIATLPPPQKDGSLQLVVGRALDCDVVVDDPAVSLKHAAILWDGRAGLLRELGSSNGTFVNGMRIGSRAALRTGDDLSFGKTHFVYLLTSELYASLIKTKK